MEHLGYKSEDGRCGSTGQPQIKDYRPPVRMHLEPTKQPEGRNDDADDTDEKTTAETTAQGN